MPKAIYKFLTHPQYDLPSRVSALAPFLSPPSLAERKHLFDIDFDAASDDQIRDLGQLVSAGILPDKDASDSLSRCFFLGRRLNDGDKDATSLQSFPRAILRVTANGIENDINIAHHILEPRGAIIDHFVRSELSHEVDILG